MKLNKEEIEKYKILFNDQKDIFSFLNKMMENANKIGHNFQVKNYSEYRIIDTVFNEQREPADLLPRKDIEYKYFSHCEICRAIISIRCDKNYENIKIHYNEQQECLEIIHGI